MAMHCENCLRAEHNSCRIMLPVEWEDDLGRCICKCRRQEVDRLTNKERIRTEERQKPTPKPHVNAEKAAKAKRTKVHAHDYVAPRKWTDERIKQLVALECEGLSSRQIAARLNDGTGMDTVRTYLSVARKKGWR